MALVRKTWDFHQPHFLSIQGSDSSRLGVDYADGVDTRWPDQVTLGPHIQSLSLSAAGGTAANVNGIADSGGMNATAYLYLIRGTKWAKVRASDMTLISDGTETALAEDATCILRTSNGTTEEISIGMNATAYRVISTVSALATDTHSANNEGQVARILARAFPGNRIFAGQPSGTVIKQNDLRSATMDASAYTTRATLTGENLRFTGFALDGKYWIVGTSNGPYVFNNDDLRFRPIIEEIDNTLNASASGWQNCTNMMYWSFAGVLCPLTKRLRRIVNIDGGESVGPEAFVEWNRSPVQGYATAQAGSDQWLYAVFLNPVTGLSWLCAGRPREAGDWHSNFLSWYVIAQLSSACDALYYAGQLGGRTLPTFIGGAGSNAMFWGDGRLSVYPDDTSYPYAASGTVYLTKIRFGPQLRGKLKGIRLKTANLSSARTIAINVAVDGRAAAQFGATLNDANAHQDGWHGVDDFLGEQFEGEEFQISLTFTGSAAGATTSPKVIGDLDAVFDVTEWAGPYAGVM